MGIEAKAGFRGLVTAVGEATAPQGALRRADNVSLRKEGALTLRPPFAVTALPVASPRAAFAYKGAYYYVGANNALYNAAGTQLGWAYTNTAAAGSVLYPTAVRDDIQAAREARGNLYLASAGGAFKVMNGTGLLITGSTPTDAAIAYASMAAPTSGDILAPNTQVAYRSVFVCTDANGVVTRSRPSGAIVVSTASAGTPVLTIYPRWRNTTQYPEQKIELYRTRVFPTTAQPDDELQLVATFTFGNIAVGGGVISVSPLTYSDKIPDTSRTTTLYTSPSRGGIENANDRPPGAACIERFRTSLFFGNIVGPQRLVFSYNAAGNVTGQATGVGYRDYTGTNAAGATTITGLSSTVGIRVGQIVGTQTSGASPTNNGVYRTVTGIAGTTVTVSLPLANAQTTQNVRFTDAISIDGWAVNLGVGVNAGSAFHTTSGSLSHSGPGVWTGYELTPPTPGYNTTFVLESIVRGGAPAQVKASRGDEMSPSIPLSTAVSGVSTTNDVLPHGLAWSEPDEPEHVPPKNFARVGDAGKAILALVATKDRLLIFKEDGLFMLTGNTAKDFAIYPLDTTCLCILPGSVRRMQNTVYALTNLGLVAVDEGGSVNVISRPIQQDIAIIAHNIRTAHKASSLYLMPGLSGVTGTGDDGAGEYWLALGTQTALGGQVLVYNAFVGGFTTYSLASGDPVCVAQSGEGLPLVLTASTLNTPVPDQTAIGTSTVATVRTRAFTDPALVNKLWVHAVVGFSQLYGASSVVMQFSGSEAQATPISEELDAYKVGGTTITHTSGTLMRHPIPRIFARSYLMFLGVTIDVQSGGGFTLELMGMESRENIPNKRPTHGSGST